MLVIDIETTGLFGLPNDRVLEIGIAELVPEHSEVRAVYQAVIHYPNIWEFVETNGPVWVFGNSSLKMEDVIQSEKSLEQVIREVREIVNEVREIVEGKAVTAYNIPFDFKKFLFFPPWDMKGLVKIMPDIMDMASEKVYELADADLISDKGPQRYLLENRANSRYDHCWVRSNDAYHVLCPDDPRTWVTRPTGHWTMP